VIGGLFQYSLPFYVFNFICFFLQNSWSQRDCAHMEFLHEASDAAKWWENSPRPHFILRYCWTFPITGQCEQFCWRSW
jgi:hypothetical protein